MTIQHFIWILWHNIGEPVWSGVQILALAWLVTYWVSFWITRGIRDGRKK